jgi:hypothetical protein
VGAEFFQFVLMSNEICIQHASLPVQIGELVPELARLLVTLRCKGNSLLRLILDLKQSRAGICKDGNS